MDDAFEAEEWRDIPGWEGYYQASSEGRVRSLPRIDTRGYRIRGRVLSTDKGHRGYGQAGLCRGGVETKESVHVLVLVSFAGPAPDGMEACHKDGNPSNNRLSNLRWGTHLSNIQDKKEHGTERFGERHSQAKLTTEAVREIRKLRVAGLTFRELGALAGVRPETAFKICSGLTWGDVL